MGAWAWKHSCQVRPEECIESPGARVAGSCESPYMGARDQTLPLQD